MIEQKPLPKSLLTKTTLVAHASKLIIKIWGSNPNWRLQLPFFDIEELLHKNKTLRKKLDRKRKKKLYNIVRKIK